jgi:aspartate kinase
MTRRATPSGRGGSDASAVTLGATECEIFTDSPAVFTADLQVVPDATPLASIRHEEMLEIAEAGSGVMQSRSIGLAVASRISQVNPHVQTRLNPAAITQGE